MLRAPIWLSAALTILAGLATACSSAPAATPVRPTTVPATSAPASGAAAPTMATASSPEPAAATTAGSGAAATTARSLPPAPNRPVARVNIGDLGTTADLVFYMAQEKGYFAHMKIEPNFERFDTGGRMIASLATNQIDVGGGSPSVGLYNSIARGVNVKMVADRASGAPGRDAWNFIVRKELAESGQARDWGDMFGRRVAIAARGISSEALIGYAAERSGRRMDEVEIVEMPYPDMAIAMATGAIDFGILPEPYASIAEQRGGAVRWKSSQELLPNNVASTIMFTDDFIQQRPDVARDFMVVYLMGVRDYNDAFIKEQPEALAEARDLLLRKSVLTDRELLMRMKAGFIHPDGYIDKEALNRDYQWFRQNAGLTETVDLDKAVDTSLAAYAVSVLGGPYR